MLVVILVLTIAQGMRYVMMNQKDTVVNVLEAILIVHQILHLWGMFVNPQHHLRHHHVSFISKSLKQKKKKQKILITYSDGRMNFSS